MTVRCFEKPELTSPLVSNQFPFRQRLHALRSLDALGKTAPQYTTDLAATLAHLRAGSVPADRLQGLRTHALTLQSQLSEILSLIPLQQPATAKNPTSQS